MRYFFAHNFGQILTQQSFLFIIVSRVLIGDKLEIRNNINKWRQLPIKLFICFISQLYYISIIYNVFFFVFFLRKKIIHTENRRLRQKKYYVENTIVL